MAATEVASLFATLSLRDNLTSGLQGASRQLSGFESSMSSMGSRMQSVGASMSLLSAPVLALGAAGLQAASSFEGVMTQLEMFGGLTADQLDMVSEAALRMGADTMFSAQDAAEAMLEFAKSGLDVEASMAAAEQALTLAAVGGMSVAEAAAAVSSAVSMFNLDPIDESNQVIDALAQAANASRADVRGLSAALRTGGTVAHQYGLSINETAAALAIMADNGIEGENAGTQLRSMLLAMTADTEDTQAAWDRLGTSFYDSEGNIRDFNTVIEELDAALDLLPVEEQNELMAQLAGSYGITGLSALRAAGGIDDMQEAMAAAPDAADLAESAMGTFGGTIDSLKGSVEALMIQALTPFMQNVLTPLAARATEVVNAITEWVAANPELVAQLLPILAAGLALGPVLAIIGTAMGALAPIVGLLVSPLGLVALAIGSIALMAGDPAVRAGLDEITEGISELLASVGGLGGALGNATAAGGGAGGLHAIIDPLIALSGAISGGALSGIGETLGAVGDAIGGLTEIITAAQSGDIQGFAEGLGNALLGLVGAAVQLPLSIFDGVLQFFAGLLGVDLPSISEGIANIGTGLSGIPAAVQQLWDDAQGPLDDFANWFNVTIVGAINEFIASVQGIWAAVSTALGQLRDGIIATLQPVVDLIANIGHELTNILNAGSSVNHVASSGPSSGPGHASAGIQQGTGAYGIPNIPKTGMYKLHQGEEVLTKGEARGRRQGGGGGGDTIIVNSYGQNPYDLVDMIERARRDRGD